MFQFDRASGSGRWLIWVIGSSVLLGASTVGVFQIRRHLRDVPSTKAAAPGIDPRIPANLGVPGRDHVSAQALLSQQGNAAMRTSLDAQRSPVPLPPTLPDTPGIAAG